MLELKRGNKIDFFKVTVTTLKNKKSINTDYLVNEYEAPNTNLAVALVMEKISPLTEVKEVTVKKFEKDF